MKTNRTVRRNSKILILGALVSLSFAARMSAEDKTIVFPAPSGSFQQLRAHMAYLGTNSGLVGIGTTNPVATLHVIGAERIDGNFVQQNGIVGIGTIDPDPANNTKLDILGNVRITGAVLGAAKDIGGTNAADTGGPAKICTGSTPDVGTAWITYTLHSDMIYANVNISACGFAHRPKIIANLVGGGFNALATYSVYNPDKNGFLFYVHMRDGSDTVQTWKHLWHIEWYAIGN